MSEAHANRPRDDYWQETLRPFVNLTFLLPFLVAYELGVWWMIGGESTLRGGADGWLHHGFLAMGINLRGLLPLIVIAVLVAWHSRTEDPIQVRWETLGGMCAESFLFAFLLILMGQGLDQGLRSCLLKLDFSTNREILARTIGFLGAGIYEEFIFRLCLLPLGYLAMRAIWVPSMAAAIFSALGTSLIFSLAHYVDGVPGNDVSMWISTAIARIQEDATLCRTFIFRTIAGLFFAILCWTRGFGIAVGCHALYDICVGLIMLSEL